VAVSDEALQALSALGGVVLAADSLDTALRDICRIATAAVPAADGASLTTYDKGRPAATADGEWAHTLDELQWTEHEGPCLDAVRIGNIFRVRDFTQESRWPSYAERAVERGARSMISVPTLSEGRIIGALNVYAKEPDAFTPESVSVLEIVAAHAGLASQVSSAFFAHKELGEQLAEAMRSRAVIEQAKGVLMAVRRLDADAAFDELVRLSQAANRKLRDVAQTVVQEATRPVE
jgi:GAF domain-containing protein